MALAEQKRMTLKEEVRFFADESKSRIVFTFKARQVLDVHAEHDVFDEYGRQLGYFSKQFGASLLRSTWNLAAPGVQAVGQERRPLLAILRRIWEFIPFLGEIWVPFIFHLDFVDTTTGQVVSAISTAVSWVGTVQSALRLVGFIAPEPNPFDQLYDRIQKDMRVLLTATLAGATEARLRDVGEQNAIARTAAQTANEYILAGRPASGHLAERFAHHREWQVLGEVQAPGERQEVALPPPEQGGIER